MFTAILRKSMRNLQTCTEVGLIQLVLLKMSSVDDMIAGTTRSAYTFLPIRQVVHSENVINGVIIMLDAGHSHYKMRKS